MIPFVTLIPSKFVERKFREKFTRYPYFFNCFKPCISRRLRIALKTRVVFLKRNNEYNGLFIYHIITGVKLIYLLQ